MEFHACLFFSYNPTTTSLECEDDHQNYLNKNIFLYRATYTIHFYSLFLHGLYKYVLPLSAHYTVLIVTTLDLPSSLDLPRSVLIAVNYLLLLQYDMLDA